ncbi:hypothetical protein J3F84DRAFT_374888 [Trichoderma pleuroticola]
MANKDTRELAGDERSGSSPSALQVGYCAVLQQSTPTYVCGWPVIGNLPGLFALFSVASFSHAAIVYCLDHGCRSAVERKIRLSHTRRAKSRACQTQDPIRRLGSLTKISQRRESEFWVYLVAPILQSSFWSILMRVIEGFVRSAGNAGIKGGVYAMLDLSRQARVGIAFCRSAKFWLVAGRRVAKRATVSRLAIQELKKPKDY